jgi:hypothetical protein
MVETLPERAWEDKNAGEALGAARRPGLIADERQSAPTATGHPFAWIVTGSVS